MCSVLYVLEEVGIRGLEGSCSQSTYRAQAERDEFRNVVHSVESLCRAIENHCNLELRKGHCNGNGDFLKAR